MCLWNTWYLGIIILLRPYTPKKKQQISHDLPQHVLTTLRLAETTQMCALMGYQHPSTGLDRHGHRTEGHRFQGADSAMESGEGEACSRRSFCFSRGILASSIVQIPQEQSTL